MGSPLDLAGALLLQPQGSGVVTAMPISVFYMI